MRRLLSFLLPLALAGFAIAPACAQRGGHAGIRMGGGSFAARGSIGFHGQPQAHQASPPYPFGHGPAPEIMRSFNQRTAPSMQGRRLGGRDWREGGRGRRFPYAFTYNPYLVPNAVGYPFGLCDPFYDTLDFCDLPYGDAYDLNGYNGYGGSYNSYEGRSAPAPENPAPENLAPEIAERGSYAPAPPVEPEAVAGEEQSADGYRPEYQAPASEEAHPQPATTLVFKDRRPSEQVHNYVLTATTLYGLDEGAHKEIPTSEIDLPATVKANRAAGVEFNPPGNISSLP